MVKKNIVVLGSTGSIGESALDVVRSHPDYFRVIGLAAGSNIKKLQSQVREFSPRHVAVACGQKAKEAKRLFRGKVKVWSLMEGVCALASLKEADIIVMAVTGFRAIFPLLAAVTAGKQIALANKEAIVIAGELVLKAARRHRAKIVPVDSEQSAIFQCLEGYERCQIDHLYLTASGGPLLGRSAKALKNVSIKTVLAHPRWRMGKKITVDSATLMNKGLEVLEARWLFGVDLERIKVVVHPQALVHSMVEFVDGSLLAQLAATDMRIPIQYALTYPGRLSQDRWRLNPLTMGQLSFFAPDVKAFPCLGLAYEAARLGGTAACALNAANEEAVEAFLSKKLSFGDIHKVTQRVLKEGLFSRTLTKIEDILDTDAQVRVAAKGFIAKQGKKGF